MFTDESIYFIYGGQDPGVAMGFVIDEDLVYDIPTWTWVYDTMVNSDNIIDVSLEYPEHDGVVVEFIKNEIPTERLMTTEYFGSILLSDPLILNMEEYENGSNVIYPNAKFIDNKFIYNEVI